MYAIYFLLVNLLFTMACPPRISASVDIICDLDGISQDCNKSLADRTIATMKCKPHYSEAVNRYSTAVCSGGSWDLPMKQCYPECGGLVSKGTTFIVNGVTAKQVDFPWHVAIYRQKINDVHPNYICGGSIISVKVVLSAAHCFSEDTKRELLPISQFYVAAGKYYSHYNAPLDNPAVVQKRKILKIQIPDIYKATQSYYEGDVAVAIVDNPFVVTNVVNPVCVDWNSVYENEQLRLNNLGQIAGWESTKPENRKASFELKQFTASYIDRSLCLDTVPELFILPFITRDKFCAGYTNESSTCKGDSGGGMVFNREPANRKKKFYIRGIMSASLQKEGNCKKHQYGIYTRVSDYISFIRTHEAKNRDTLIR